MDIEHYEVKRRFYAGRLGRRAVQFGQGLRALADNLEEYLEFSPFRYLMDGKRPAQQRVQAVTSPHHDKLPRARGRRNVRGFHGMPVDVGRKLFNPDDFRYVLEYLHGGWLSVEAISI